jgi:hypothetical protein
VEASDPGSLRALPSDQQNVLEAKCDAPDYVNSVSEETRQINDGGIPSLLQLT